MYFYSFNKTYYTQGDKKDLSSAEIKKECCQTTCYSLFTAKNLTCPVGHSAPTKVDRKELHSPDRKLEELQRDCCKKPRVTCYTMLKDNKFTCPSTHIKPTAHYLNDDIHEDMSTKTAKELETKCCREKSKCFTKLTSKKLNCDGFGTMISKKWLTCCDFRRAPFYRPNVFRSFPNPYVNGPPHRSRWQVPRRQDERRRYKRCNITKTMLQTQLFLLNDRKEFVLQRQNHARWCHILCWYSCKNSRLFCVWWLPFYFFSCSWM